MQEEFIETSLAEQHVEFPEFTYDLSQSIETLSKIDIDVPLPVEDDEYEIGNYDEYEEFDLDPFSMNFNESDTTLRKNTMQNAGVSERFFYLTFSFRKI